MIDTFRCYESAVLAAKNGRAVNEDVGDWLFKKIRDTKRDIIPPGTDGKFINRQTEILKLIRDGNYDKAIAVAKDNGVTDKTLFDQIVLFGRDKYLGLGRFTGKRYYKIPFLFAATASVIDGYTKIGAITSLVTRGFRRIFIEGGLGSGASLSIKSEESTKFSDFCSFMLTNDGTLNLPTADTYSTDNEMSIIGMFQNLINFGWKPGNIATTAPGLLFYLVNGDFILSLKFLAKNGCLTPSPEYIDSYGISKERRVYDFFANSKEHDFELHDTEVTRNGDEIVGGEFHDKMLALGYDIKSKEVQSVPFATFFVLAQELSLIHSKYTNNGEKLNTKKVTLFSNANITTAANSIKEIIQKYVALINDPTYKKATNEQKNVMIQQFIARIGQVVAGIEKKANDSLSNLGLPKVKFSFKNKLDPNSKALYRDMNMFVKELNDAVKLSKSVF